MRSISWIDRHLLFTWGEETLGYSVRHLHLDRMSNHSEMQEFLFTCIKHRVGPWQASSWNESRPTCLTSGSFRDFKKDCEPPITSGTSTFHPGITERGSTRRP